MVPSLRLAALVAAASLGAAACSPAAPIERADAAATPVVESRALPPVGRPPSFTGPATTLGLPSSTAAPTTSTTLETVGPGPRIEAGAKGLGPGSSGAAVEQLEHRLAQLRFNPGKLDGRYDAHLVQAVMAFQKQQGLKRTGRADPETLTRVAEVDLGAPAVPNGEPDRVEVDLPRQIAQVWRDGKLVRVLPVSTGNGVRYCLPKSKGGACDVAVTPGGSYRADRKIKGLRVSNLGSLYDPVYFNGGIAIHGSPSVPAGPASHGCVRVPMWESRWVHDNVRIGDPVYVVGGKVAPVPFAEKAPTESGDEVTTT